MRDRRPLGSRLITAGARHEEAWVRRYALAWRGALAAIVVLLGTSYDIGCNYKIVPQNVLIK